MNKMISIAFILMGLAAGLTLLLAPFGLAPLASGPLMWFAFPLATSLGYLLLVSGASGRELAASGQLVGGALLLLGLAALVARFLVGGGLLSAPGNTLSLWYVAGCGLTLGSLPYALRGFGQGPGQ